RWRPAQKDPAAPVRIATGTSGVASTRQQASAMPSHISKSSPLRRSGLLSVIVASGALISTWTVSVTVSSVELADGGGQPRVVEVRLVRLVERGAVGQSRVALGRPVAELVGGRPC